VSDTEVQSAASWPFILPGSGRDAISQAVAQVDPMVFREYDLRGRVDVTSGPIPSMNEGVASRIGKAFGTLLSARGLQKVVVGFDSRSYSQRLANAVMTGLLSTGTDVINLGLSTTPIVYYAQHALGGLPAITVTASHNPNGWAGMKLGYGPSSTLGPAEVAELKTVVDEGTFSQGSGRYSERSVTEMYIDELVARVPFRRAVKVVIDGGNSISGPVAELVIRKAGHQVTVINRELDWDFPNHEPDPEALEARRQISKAVRDTKSDIGLSFDGDGDRLGVTDEKGEVIWPDRVLALLAADTLSRHPGSQIVFDVKCSRLVPDVITAHGGIPIMWMTGHSHIKSKMKEIGAPFAGERSGHFFDAADYYGFDDGLYAGMRLLQILSGGQESISDLVRSFGSYISSPAMQAACPDDRKYDVVEEFATYAEGLGASELIRINGVRAEFDDGWILVRASSNLPALVILAEADSEPRLRQFYEMLRRGLVDSGLVGPEWENDPWQVTEGQQ
jgi:phosphomannomutase/phosphoglucomutase